MFKWTLNSTPKEILPWQQLFKAICKSPNSTFKHFLWEMMLWAVIELLPILPQWEVLLPHIPWDSWQRSGVSAFHIPSCDADSGATNLQGYQPQWTFSELFIRRTGGVMLQLQLYFNGIWTPNFLLAQFENPILKEFSVSLLSPVIHSPLCNCMNWTYKGPWSLSPPSQ